MSRSSPIFFAQHSPFLASNIFPSSLFLLDHTCLATIFMLSLCLSPDCCTLLHLSACYLICFLVSFLAERNAVVLMIFPEDVRRCTHQCPLRCILSRLSSSCCSALGELRKEWLGQSRGRGYWHSQASAKWVPSLNRLWGDCFPPQMGIRWHAGVRAQMFFPSRALDNAAGTWQRKHGTKLFNHIDL